MNHKELNHDELRALLSVRLRPLREADPEQQERAAALAQSMLQRDVPWPIVLAALRQEFPDTNPPEPENGVPSMEIDPGDLATAPPPPLRHEAGRNERERLSSTTRQTLRVARGARRWHEIKKMRNVLLGIDQAHLKRMLGAESEILNHEINSLLRSWAPLVKERQQGGRPIRRRR